MKPNLSIKSQLLAIPLLNPQSFLPFQNEAKEILVKRRKKLLKFCSSLIEILTKKDDNELRLSSAIKLKNCVKKKWKTLFTDELQNIIKKTILKLLVNSKEKNELKQYKAIITKIIKDNSWSDYFDEITIFINSSGQNPFKGYCGVLCFLILAKQNSVKYFKTNFEKDYAVVHNHLLQIFLALIQKNDLNEFEVNYICLIIKVWVKAIEKQPPIDFIESFNVIFQHIIQFTPKNIQVRQNCLRLLEEIYHNFFDVTKPKDEDDFPISMYLNENQYVFSLFIYFYSYIIDKDKYTTNTQKDENSISLCYNFLLLAMTRNEKDVMLCINTNLSNLIIASIRNNMLSQNVLDVDEKTFLIAHYDVYSDSKRKTITQFIEKLASIQGLGWKAIEILMNQLALIEIEKQKENTKYNLLLKESCLFLMMNMIQKQQNNDQVSVLIYDIICKYISKEIIVTNIPNDDMKLFIIALKFECINFLNVISESKEFTNEEIQYLMKSLSDGLLLQGHLIIKTICAITLSNIITYSEDSIAFAQNSIIKLLSLYLILIKEIELEELIFSIENIIDHYPKQAINFASELSKELMVIFQTYICKLKESKRDEKTNIDYAACGILSLLSALFSISNEEENKLNEVLLICNDMMLYALSKQCRKVSRIVYEKAIYTITNLIELVENIPSLMWKWLDTLLNSIVTFLPISKRYIKGVGFDSLHKVFPIVFFFIIKDPNTFISIYDKTLIVLENIIFISHNRKDELSCTYAIRILIAIFETYDTNTEVIFKSLERLLPLLTKELLLHSHKPMYLKFLIQVIALIIKFNPVHVLHYLQTSNQLKNLLDKWMTAINSMRYDFEFRRSIYGLFSMLCLPSYLIPSTIMENFDNLINRTIEAIDKLIILTEKKNMNIIEKAKISGEEISKDEAKKTSSLFNQDKDDDSEYNEDEDYCPEDEDNQSIKILLLTKLEKGNVFEWIKSMLNIMKPVNNGEQYQLIVSKIKNPVLLNLLNDS